MKFFTKAKAIVVATSVAVFGMISVPAFATAPDYTTLSTAVDFSGAQTAILAIAATVLGLIVVVASVKWIFHAAKGR